MKKASITAVLLGACLSPSWASEWNTFNNVSADNMFAYFDAESIVKRGDVSTVWLKYVYDTNSTQPGDTYSLAVRMVFNCKARTVQTLTSSSYDKSGTFQRTNSTPGPATDIVPDSIGDLMSKSVCAANFPNNKGISTYAPALNNDPRFEASKMFEYLRAQKADPAPK